MGKFLLDTHTFVWLDNEPERLSRVAKRTIRSRGAEIFVSAISLYEIVYKVRKQHGGYSKDLILKLNQQVRLYDLRVLPVQAHHSIRAATMDWDHRDPFDRLIAAQALEESCILVTADAEFTSAPDVKILW
jgi:PIN domain nuclease of toxin-antitoxin system